MKKTWRSNLDEQQEQTLLKIEHNGCWFAFWGLLVALLVQQFIYGPEAKYVAGEWIVFMILCIYLAFACVRNGIWDRRFKPDAASNLKASLIAAIVFGIFTFAVTFHRFGDMIYGSAAAGLISGVIVFVLCFIALQIMAKSYEKRRAEMDEEPEEE